MSILIGYTEDAFPGDREDVKFGFRGDIAIPEEFDADANGARAKLEFAPYEDKVVRGQFSYRKAMSICPLIVENSPGMKPKKVVIDQLSAEYNSAYMAMLKFDAGTSFKVQAHEGFLVVVVLKGDYVENGVSYEPGQTLIQAPKAGSENELSSVNGCTLLVSRYKPVEGDIPDTKGLKFDFGGDVDYDGQYEFTAFDGSEGGLEGRFRPYKSTSGLIKGVSHHVLFNDTTEAGFEANKGADLAFLKYEGNDQAAAKLHHHQGYETVLVMQGDYIENGASFAPGHLVVRVPGTHHEMTSHDGCVIFASRRMPVQGCIGKAEEMTKIAEAKLLAKQG
jgi:anti-sigma factor ChrR (cupin superfamily)